MTTKVSVTPAGAQEGDDSLAAAANLFGARILGRSPLRRLKQRARVLCVAFYKDMMYTGGTGDGEICVCDPNTGQLEEVLTGHTMSVTCLLFAFGRLWSGSCDHHVSVWDPSTNERVLTIKNHHQQINCLARSGDLVFVAGEEPTIYGYNAAGIAKELPTSRAMEKLQKPLITFTGHTAWVTTLIPRQMSLWSSSYDGTIRCWSPQRQACLKTVPTGLTNVCGLAICMRRGWIICSGINGSVHVLDMEGKKLRQLQGHSQVVRCLLLWESRDVLLTCGRDETVKVWDLVRGEQVETIFGHDKSVNTMVLRGSELFTGAGDKMVLVWGVEDLLGSLTVEQTESQQQEAERGMTISSCCSIL